VFNEAQLKQLQSLLGLERQEEAFSYAHVITVSFEHYLFRLSERKKSSDIKSIKRELSKLTKDAKSVVICLKRSPMAAHVVWPHLNDSDIEGIASTEVMQKLWEGDRKQLKRMIDDLQTIAKMAEYYLDRDDRLRSTLHLPKRKDAGKLPYVASFWPILLVIWKGVGKEPAGTKDGPLHRFISLVHVACGLPEVSASTLRDAATEWKQDRKEMDAAWKHLYRT
jgi:hypothetical protein